MSRWRFSGACVVVVWMLVVLLPTAVAPAATHTSDSRIHAASAVVELPVYYAAGLTYDERVEIAPNQDAVPAMSPTLIATVRDAAGVAPETVPRRYDQSANDLVAPNGAGDGLVDLYRAPQPGQATGPLDPADFPGSFANGVPDGRSYWTLNRELADEYAGAYGTDVISVSIPRADYDAMFDVLKHASGAGEFPYPGPGGFVEVAIQRWMVRWLNNYRPG